MTPERRLSRSATKRDVYWVGSVTIVVSILAVVVSVVRTQQQADARIRDNQRASQARDIDHRNTERALALSLKQSNYDSCERSNRHDQKLLSYVDGQVTRQRASFKATIGSPTTTQDQKQTSFRNLVGAVYQQQQLHAALKPDVCTKPPIPKRPTSTTTAPTRGSP